MDDDMLYTTEGVAPGNLGAPYQTIPPAPAPGVGAFGRRVTVLKYPGLRGPNDQPTYLVASVSSFPSTQIAQQQGAAGPLVGIVQWGSGNGAQQTAEFDVPFQFASSTLGPGIGPGVSVGSGTLLAVFGTSLEIAVRNDGNLIPRAGDARLGPSSGAVPAGTFDALATASMAVGSRPTSKLYRTVFGAFDPAGGGLAPADTVIVPIPPFAKSVRIARFNSAQAISVRIIGITNNFNGPFAVAAGADSPEFVIASLATQVAITNTGAANIASVAAVFEIGL